MESCLGVNAVEGGKVTVTESHWDAVKARVEAGFTETNTDLQEYSFTCDKCGAVVVDWVSHNDWHKETFGKKKPLFRDRAHFLEVYAILEPDTPLLKAEQAWSRWLKKSETT